MQQKYKHSFTDSRMQKDLDARLVSKSEYRDAVNVSVSRSEGADVGALENILGNQFVNNLQYTGSEPCEIIGMYEDISDDSIFLFLTNYQDNSTDKLSNRAPYEAVNKIVYFNTKTNTSQTIVEGYFLNLSINSPIYHINMIEDLLFWTDNRNQPRQINTKLAIDSSTYYVNEDQISVGKYYPYDPIDVVTKYELTGCYVDKQIEGRTPSFPSTATWYGYDAIYDYFMLTVNPSSTIISKLRNNIGVKGYITNGNNRWEFRVAWFQQDGDSYSISTSPPEGGTIQHDNVMPAPYNSAGDRKYLLFIDRELSSAGLTKYNNASGIPASPDTYTITIIEETSKDVSNPWRGDDIGKFKISAESSGTLEIQKPCTIANVNNKLYAFGTRSWPMTATSPQTIGAPTAANPNYDAWQQTPKSAPTSGANPILPVFRIDNGFPDNSTASSNFARNIYPRITHHKIPITVYVAMTNVLNSPVSGDVTNTALGTNREQIQTCVYSALSDGGTLAIIDLNAEYGIDVGDIITIQWPNKFYDSTFPGDPDFLDDKFVRFSYRFQFDNGEYSLIAPFTQPVFIPKQGGYFRKEISTSKASGEALENVPTTQQNSWEDQALIAGQNTIVDFFTNKITEINLNIPLEMQANELATNLKVKEIDILYKEADALAIKVVESVPIGDYSSITDKFLSYQYQSRKPIKVLPESELTRVYDNIPVRAATQSSSGNRIIYGNFYDRHTSPPSLDYFVGVSSKFTPSFPETSNSDSAYPNHTLKQNRNYQVGIVLSDRYGRQSDVILSSVQDNTFTKRDGLYVNDPIVFGGSTVYSPYFDSVVTPKSNLTVANQQSGIVGWPGDSLKVLFNSVIPETISTSDGYPGLYQNNVTKVSATGVSFGTGVTTLTLSAGLGSPWNTEPGDTIEWIESGVVKKNIIKDVSYVNSSSPVSVQIEDTGNYPASFPTEAQIYKVNPLGWYSYKVVVKQNQQDYYNVYLPSLLAGEPEIKPFKLAVKAVALGDTTITVDSTVFEPRTFLLTEGVQFVTGTQTYTVINIINNDQFQINPASNHTIVAGTELTFFKKPSTNRNVTTLLTDNLNKVPPGLNEVTPVQVNYTTSDTELIPRVARNLNFNRTKGTNPYISTAGGPYYSGPIFPKRNRLKVTALGNFFNLFKDPSIAGLYEATTNPTSAIIDNIFNIGTPSDLTTPWNCLPDVEYPTNYAVYETNPTISNIDIFWETSTSGLVSELNEAILSDPLVPVSLVSNRPQWQESQDMGATAELVGGIQFRNYLGDPIEFSLMNGGGPTITSWKDASGTNLGVLNVTWNASTLNTGLIRVTNPAAWDRYAKENVNFNNFIATLNVNIDSPYPIDYNFDLPIEIVNIAPVAVQFYPEANVVRGTDIPFSSGVTNTTRTGGGSAVWSSSSGGFTEKTLYITTNGAWGGAAMDTTGELVYYLEYLETTSGTYLPVPDTGSKTPYGMTGLTLVPASDALGNIGVAVSVGNVLVNNSEGLLPTNPPSTRIFKFRISSKDRNGVGLASTDLTYFSMNFIFP